MFYNQSNQPSSNQLSPQKDQVVQKSAISNNNSPMQEQQNNDGNNQFADFKSQGSLHPRILYLRRLYFLMTLQYTFIIGLYYFLQRWSFTTIQKIQDNSYIFYLFLLGIIILGVVAMMIRKQIRQMPVNLIYFLVWYLCFAGGWLVYLVRHAEAFTFMIFVSMWLLITSQFFYSLCVRTKLTQQGSSLFIFATLIILFEAFSLYTRLNLFSMIIVLIFGFFFAFLLVLDTQTKVGSEDSYDWTSEEPFSGSILVYFDMFGLIIHQFYLLKNLIISNRN